jgi:hypothetical protein
MRTYSLVLSFAMLSGPALADVLPLPANRNIDINVSNDNGAQYGSGPNDSYFISAPGGGLNQLHITTDSSAAGVNGQVTTQNITTSSASGTFWVSTTGGRGYNDALVLLVSLQGPVSSDFSLNINSSGYQWTATPNAIGSDIHYAAGAVQETFGQSDFLYGPQTAKPGPGNGWILPFYSGQDINDSSTASYLMFIDLYLGNLSDRSLTDSGNAKVEFSVSGLYEATLAFNVYAYALTANIDDASINWTNRVSTNPAEVGQSGYSITSSALSPTPLPPSVWMMGSGLAGIWFASWRRQNRKKAKQV